MSHTLLERFINCHHQTLNHVQISCDSYIIFLHSTKYYFKKVAYISMTYYYINFQNPTLCGASVVTTSDVRSRHDITDSK
jgi:hypothetical protein